MKAQPIRVLLVDDDAPFLRSLEALLSAERGLEIVGMAASGREALAAAARVEPDVAVIDVLMPTMSGIECAKQNHRMHGRPGTCGTFSARRRASRAIGYFL